MEGNAYNLLLDIDALFDTRMGTLICLDNQISKHLPLKDYRGRYMDNFEKLTGGAITDSAFKERYANRDYEVISSSIVTGIVPVLMSYLDGLKERFFRGVDVKSIGVDLNVYPYKLPGPILETMRGCLESLLPAYAVINIVDVTPEEMTPEWFEYRYNGWVTYSFHPWLEHHHTRLLVKPLNGVTVILPKLFVEEPGERVVKEDEGNFKPEDRHGQFEMIMEEFIHLEHIPVSDYCFLLPGTYRVEEEQDIDLG